MGERWEDLPAQLGALGAVARQAGVDTLVLRDPATLAWLLQARVHVPQTLDVACLDAVVDVTTADPTLTIVTNAIEAPRLQETELADIPADWAVVPWWEARDMRVPSGPRTGSDRPAGGMADLTAAITTVRRRLSGRQLALLGGVSRDAAAAATRTAARVTPQMSEYAAAGLLAEELLSAELDPVVLMVGGGDRGGRHRHPLPTGELLGRRAMLVCCARRHGLIASVTRIVSFDPLTVAQRDAYGRLLEVERAFLDVTLPGARLGDVFAAGVAAYPARGFAAQEWQRHHQGGLSGLQPREFPAHHGTDVVLQDGTVVAWNPSADGWKVEDTAIVRPGGPDLLVDDPRWPSVEVGGRRRPDVLVR